MMIACSAPVRRIVVMRALFLGDLICALPAFRLLRERFPLAEITLIAMPWAEELVRRVDCIDRLLPFPGAEGINELPYDPERTAAFVAEAQQTGYDLAIQMHGSGATSNGFVAQLGARASWGYGPPGDQRLDHVLPHPDDDHEIVRWLRLAAAVSRFDGGVARLPGGGPLLAADYPVPPLATTSAEEALADELLGRTEDRGPRTENRSEAAMPLTSHPSPLTPHLSPLIALHPGAKDPARRWPVEHFAALGDALAQRYGAAIVLTGGAGEREITRGVARAMRAPARDLAGTTDLGTFAALIGRLDLLVTNDTGASHLAIAQGTPSVVLFGPSRPAHWGPLNRARHHVIDAQVLVGGEGALGRLPVAPVLEACAAKIEEAAQHELSTREVGQP